MDNSQRQSSGGLIFGVLAAFAAIVILAAATGQYLAGENSQPQPATTAPKTAPDTPASTESKQPENPTSPDVKPSEPSPPGPGNPGPAPSP